MLVDSLFLFSRLAVVKCNTLKFDIRDIKRGDTFVSPLGFI